MRILLFLLIGSFALGLQAQDSRPLISHLEMGWQHAIFDPAQGLTVKANHTWRQMGKARLQSGVMLSALLRPAVSPSTSGTNQEHYSAYRLNVHTGWVRGFGDKQRFYGILEGYLGLRSYYTRGSLDQPSQGFSREYRDFTMRGDLGIRFGLGYQLTDRLGVQSAVTASLIDVNHPLGFYTGVLFWGPDVLSLVEISLNWRLGE